MNYDISNIKMLEINIIGIILYTQQKISKCIILVKQ